MLLDPSSGQQIDPALLRLLLQQMGEESESYAPEMGSVGGGDLSGLFGGMTDPNWYVPQAAGLVGSLLGGPLGGAALGGIVGTGMERAHLGKLNEWEDAYSRPRTERGMMESIANNLPLVGMFVDDLPSIADANSAAFQDILGQWTAPAESQTYGPQQPQNDIAWNTEPSQPEYDWGAQQPEYAPEAMAQPEEMPTIEWDTPAPQTGGGGDESLYMRKGGVVPKDRNPSSDARRGTLHEGEFVIKREIVQKYGLPFFHALNAGKI